MYFDKLEKEFYLVFKSLEATQAQIIKSMTNLDDYLSKQNGITTEEKLFIEDSMITLDMIRIKTKDSIFMLKKNKLEKNKKIRYIEPKRIRDIYVDSEDTIKASR